MDKELVLKEIKEMLEVKGKAHLMDFAEDLAGVSWDSVKILVKHTETSVDDLIVTTLDGMVESYIDKIDGVKE